MRRLYGLWLIIVRCFHSALQTCAVCVAVIAITGTLSSCDRSMVRNLIDKIGSRDKDKPPVYHEYEGYSPGARRSKAKEDFTRYHYYIAPEKDEITAAEPEIFFRQDYEPITAEPSVQFDESQYWREHPLMLEGDPTTPQEKKEE